MTRSIVSILAGLVGFALIISAFALAGAFAVAMVLAGCTLVSGHIVAAAACAAAAIVALHGSLLMIRASNALCRYV